MYKRQEGGKTVIGQKFEIMQEQKQQLSQAQIQSLEILSLDATELSQFLQNEYLENPMLDYTGDKGNPAEAVSYTHLLPHLWR